MTPAEQMIHKLHSLFCELTHRQEPFIQFSTERAWMDWIKLLNDLDGKWSPESMLRLVVDHRQQEIRAGKREPQSIAFRNVVRNTDLAADLIADALAARRNAQRARIPPSKVEVLRATGRSVEVPTPEAQPVGVILERAKLAEQLQKWKEQNL